MNPIGLFHQDGRPAKVWYCEKCRIIHPTHESATRCCGPCECGKEMDRGHAYCDTCWQIMRTRKEEERFEKAKKVPAKDWAGWVFEDGTGNSGFHESVEEFLDDWEGNSADGDEKPVYVWACKKRQLNTAHVSDVTEPILENGWEDMGGDDLSGMKELDQAIKAFNEANKDLVCYDVDYSTAIIL